LENCNEDYDGGEDTSGCKQRDLTLAAPKTVFNVTATDAKDSDQHYQDMMDCLEMDVYQVPARVAGGL